MTWQSNGLGQPLCSPWLPMDEPVGPWMLDAGPDGWMEFDTLDKRWRMWRPFDWNLGG